VHPFELAVWAFLRIASTPAPAENTLLPILLALMTGGLLASVVTWLRFRQQGPAEKENIIAEAANRAVESMRAVMSAQAERIHDLEEEVGRLRQQLEEANAQVAALQKQNVVQARELAAALSTRERIERRLHATEERLAELIAGRGS
jgi:chromosome segregation ATPase